MSGGLEPMQVDVPPEPLEAEEPPPFNVDSSPLELESYAAGYASQGRIDRLLFIADHCSALRIEALKLALQYVMETHNITCFQSIHRRLLREAGPPEAADSGVPGARPDVAQVGSQIFLK